MSAFQLFVILAVSIGRGHSDSEFTYYGTLGPDHWSEHYNQCSGKHQSPIDINDVDVIDKNYPEIEYGDFDKKPANVTMTNNGHTVLVKLTYEGPAPFISNGPLEAKGKYEFQQLHFHWGEDNTVGSEDRINNVTFPMELHVVFRNSKYIDFGEAALRDDGVAVMAFFYKIRENMDQDYDTFTGYLKNIHEPDTTTDAEPINLFGLMPKDMNNYYTYIGSLTTPPCSEDVTWMDFSDPISISSTVLERFRALKTFDGSALSHNFRPLQPLNNRKVYRVLKGGGFLPQGNHVSDIPFVNARDDGAKAISFSTGLAVTLLTALLALNIYLV